MNTTGLALAYWVHMLATVAWLGSLSALALTVLPEIRARLDERGASSLLLSIQRRLDPVGWFSLALLVGTGLFQMSANPNYSGFLAIGNTWAVAILAKHLVIGLLVVSNGLLSWSVLPALRRAALLRERGVEAPEAIRLEKRNRRLIYANLVLMVIVLALTAVARVL